MDKIVLKSTLERLVGYIKAAISGKADASELKDVKKQVENKADLVDGKVPLAQLGNIDTQVMLVVDKLPNTDIKANKIYLVKNTDSTEDQNVYTEYVYVSRKWEKLGEFKPEVDLSHIEQKLDTKADKTDVNNRLDDLRNYCFKLDSDGRISTPYNISFDTKILQLNNNEEYTYADINQVLDINEQQFIYDKTFNKFIKIIKIDEIADTSGDFFRTVEPLDLTHTFYLDNKKTGIVENLSQLAIEESNVFVNLPYVDTNDSLDNDTAPQYIYDATDNKWIEVVETYYLSDYYAFNTEEPLDLTHELYCSNINVLTNWTVVGKYSIALGYGSSANADCSIALGYGSSANADRSIALGYGSANSIGSVALGTGSFANGDYSVALGNNSYVNKDCSIALGSSSSTNGDYSVALGYGSFAKKDYSIALGTYSKAGGDYAIALGKNVSNTKSIFGVGFNGVNGIDMDRDNYGLYLRGFGGYDGTNLVVKNGGTETLNPNIKSVQQIINEKADASAIPTKLSQLTNDIKVATPNDVAIFAGLKIHNNAQIRYIQKYHHDDEDTYLIAETPDDRVANKVFAADGSLFDVSKLVKKVQCNVSGDPNNIEFGYITVDGIYKFSVIPTVTTNHAGIMSSVDKVKLDSLPSITGKLSNITAATTAEEVVTKFNALLADLKAKGYMEADE